MVQASTHSTPQGYVKDAIKKLNSTWGDTDGFSAVKKSVLLQLFSSDFKKATTYATNVNVYVFCDQWIMDHRECLVCGFWSFISCCDQLVLCSNILSNWGRVGSVFG